MKIAIPSNEDSAYGFVSEVFGRAKHFVIYEIGNDNDEYEIMDNEQNLNIATGAGIQAAKNVIDSGATVVITGHCGPKAFSVLSAANIDVIVNTSGCIMDVVEKYKLGKLKPAGEANVDGHWQ